jgi:hypothetical protein
MGFFTRDEGKKEEGSRKESDRIPAKPAETKSLPKKAATVLSSFVLGLRPNDKLENLPAERYEEGLRSSLPKGSKVTRLEGPLLVTDLSIRFYEVVLPQQDMPEALAILMGKGILDGQIQVKFEQCVVVCEAVGRSAQFAIVGDTIDRSGMRFTLKTDSPDVLVQYPPLEVHKRWLADDDYRAAYGRWRTQRSDEAKPPRWHAGWPVGSSEDAAPPWVRLKAREGGAGEYVLDFEDSMLLRFAFQGAVIRIERFNLKLTTNKLTNEFAVYRSLPLSPESLPKDIQDRMNREPDRFKSVREAGRFGPTYDLVRIAYEELGGDYYQVEMPPPGAMLPPPPPPMAEPVSLQSGPVSRNDYEEKKVLPPPSLGTTVAKSSGRVLRNPNKGLDLPKAEPLKPDNAG